MKKTKSKSKLTLKAPDFRLLFESAPGLYLVLTPDLTIIAVSDAYLRATMTERVKILGKNLFDIFPDNPNDPTATGTINLRTSLNRVLHNGIPDIMAIQKYDIRRPASEGGEFEERYWSPINTPVFDKNKKIIYIIHRVEDVTEFIKLKQQGAEQDLINQELESLKRQRETEIYLRSVERHKAEEILHQKENEVHTLNKVLNLKYKQISQLRKMTTSLQICTTIKEAAMLCVKYCNKLLQNTDGILYLMTSSKNVLKKISAWGEHLNSLDWINPNDCWALRQGHVHYVFDPSKEIVCEHVHDDSNIFRSYFCVPLIANSEIIGLFYIQFDSDQKYTNLFVKQIRVLIHQISDIIALALANIRLREDLHNQTIRDPLTGLHNRRYLEETLSREMALATRKKIPISILMIDIDHFKNINDTYGHEAGDLVLQHFAMLLKNKVRAYNTVCRLGGEEFLIAFLDLDQNTAEKRAEELRKYAEDMQITYRSQIISQITISIGVASFPENAKDPESLIALADKALYKAKESGRNQVIVYKDKKITSIALKRRPTS